MYDITKFQPTTLPEDFSPVVLTMRLGGSKKVFLESDQEYREIKVTVMPTRLQAEFDTQDFFYNQGLTREKLFKDPGRLYDLMIRRTVAGLVSDDPVFGTLTLDEKLDQVYNQNPLSFIPAIIGASSVYSGVGYPQQIRGVCKGCNREVALPIPFLAGFLVPTKP